MSCRQVTIADGRVCDRFSLQILLWLCMEILDFIKDTKGFLNRNGSLILTLCPSEADSFLLFTCHRYSMSCLPSKSAQSLALFTMCGLNYWIMALSAPVAETPPLSPPFVLSCEYYALYNLYCAQKEQRKMETKLSSWFSFTFQWEIFIQWLIHLLVHSYSSECAGNQS